MSEVKSKTKENSKPGRGVSEVNALVSGTLKPCEQRLIEWGIMKGYVTNWYFNDYYLEWLDTYYPELKDVEKQQRAFRYRINKLVEDGIFEPAKRISTGYGGYREFGSTVQTIWNLNRKYR